MNPPKVSTVVYTKQTMNGAKDLDAVSVALARAAKGYDFSKDPYVLELVEQDDDRSRKELAKVMTKRKTYCWENLRALDLRAWTMQEQLGASMSRWYVSSCVSRFREGMTSETVVMPDLSEKERKHLAGIFEDICPESTDDYMDDLAVSEKVCQLLQVLKQHDQITARGIIFVEQRVQVTALAELLGRLPDLSYRIATFVGTSASTKRKISVADLVAVKDQEQDLAAFRSGEKNLMVATNVLEEGIDVSACNLVSIRIYVKHNRSTLRLTCSRSSALTLQRILYLLFKDVVVRGRRTRTTTCSFPTTRKLPSNGRHLKPR